MKQTRLSNMRYLLIALTLSIFLGNENTFIKDFANAAINRTTYDIEYDSRYFSIDYPNGDIPNNLGVCTDVIIRSYRTIGVDLQKLIHEDMVLNFDKYPKIWGLRKPDPNIDHRRVPNLQTFFSRYGEELVVSNNTSDYSSGDIVTWFLNPDNGTIPHIGIIIDTLNTPMVVHNIGYGVVLEDMLFNSNFKITGHYKYIPKNYK